MVGKLLVKQHFGRRKTASHFKIKVMYITDGNLVFSEKKGLTNTFKASQAKI